MVIPSCGLEPGGRELDASVVAPSKIHPIEVSVPMVLRGLPMAAGDGGLLTVTPCTTCHGEHDSTPLPRNADSLGGPHAGLTVHHGTLRCAACHDAARRDQLHLADGRSVPLLDAMELCAQCHGPQKRDFDHGAHGGMRGYWDLRAGPRTQNHCVACHDPHAPRFGAFAPVARPRDRFAPQHGDQESGNHD